MYRVELFLSDYGDVRLEEIRFHSPDQKQPLITVNGGSQAHCVGAPRNLFSWTAGVRSVTILLLTAASGIHPAAIKGETRSLAASLDYALSKEPGWLIDFFGMTTRGSAMARAIFGRRNAERKRPGPVEVYVNENLLPSHSIDVFLNDQKIARDEVARLIAAIDPDSAPTIHPLPQTLESAPADDMGEFPLVAQSRVITAYINLDTQKARFTCRTTFRNGSRRPINFNHYNIYSDPPDGPQNLQISCPTEASVRWEEVLGVDSKNRVLVTFEKPLPPGDERVEILRYDLPNFSALDSRLNHAPQIPTEHLTLEMICPATYHIAGAAVIAERDNDFLFTTLPQPIRCKTETGESCLRWSIENPKLGLCYRLLWGLERRPAQSSRVPHEARSAEIKSDHQSV